MQQKKRWQRSRPNRSRYVSAPYIISQKPARLCPEQRQRLICWRRGYSRRATSTAWRDANAWGSASRSGCQTRCASPCLAIPNNGSGPCEPDTRRWHDRFCIPHTSSRRCHQPRCACGNTPAPGTIRTWTIRTWPSCKWSVWCGNAASSRANWPGAIRARPVWSWANSKASAGVCPASAHSKPSACYGRPWCRTARAKRTRDQRHAPAAHACRGFSLAHANCRQHPCSLALPQGFADI